jgi:hypothetical protein
MKMILVVALLLVAVNYCQSRPVVNDDKYNLLKILKALEKSQEKSTSNEREKFKPLMQGEADDDEDDTDWNVKLNDRPPIMDDGNYDITSEVMFCHFGLVNEKKLAELTGQIDDLRRKFMLQNLAKFMGVCKIKLLLIH